MLAREIKVILDLTNMINSSRLCSSKTISISYFNVRLVINENDSSGMVSVYVS